MFILKCQYRLRVQFHTSRTVGKGVQRSGAKGDVNLALVTEGSELSGKSVCSRFFDWNLKLEALEAASFEKSWGLHRPARVRLL